MPVRNKHIKYCLLEYEVVQSDRLFLTCFYNVCSKTRDRNLEVVGVTVTPISQVCASSIFLLTIM